MGLFAEENGIYRCCFWDEFSWQKHGFGSRLASPEVSVTLRQVHSNIVWNAHGLGDRERDGDALITADHACSIGVRTADCVPILLLDTRTHVVAAVHAGWRGTAARIVERTLHMLREDCKTEPVDVLAAIGPCIRVCCYEVSRDVADRFRDWPNSIQGSRGRKPHIDLAAANRGQLILAGVQPNQIYDSELCTSCSLDHFFSFRREPENPGRMISAICRI